MKKQEVKKGIGVSYPNQAYIAYILIIRNQQSRFFLPFNEVFTDTDQIKTYSKIHLEKSSDENTFIPPAPIIFPISLSTKIALKPQYWDKPTDELTRTDRINNFLKPLQDHRFQKLLVTPLKSRAKTILTAAYCFNIQAQNTEIDFFMTNFFLSMDEKAKFAATYQFENPFRLELDTDKKIKINYSLPSKIN